MANPITIPNNAFLIPVNVSSSYKTFTLPVVSTNAGRMLIFKDMFGCSTNSTIRLSTIGLDRIERSNISSIVLANNYGAWTFMNDGFTNWFQTNVYTNNFYIRPQFVAIPYPAGIAPVYTLGAYNISPWNVSAANWPNSSSANLQWIWFTANAQSSAPATASYFYHNYINPTAGTFKFYIIADDYSTLYYTTDGNTFTTVGSLNGGWGSSPSPSISFSLPQGSIQFKIWASNGGGPAGILMTLYNPASNVVLESDSTWYYNAT